MMSSAEVQMIDDWMFANRLRSRAEAVRRLCQIALAEEPYLLEIYKTSKEALTNYNKFSKTFLNLPKNPLTDQVVRDLHGYLDSLMQDLIRLLVKSSEIKTTVNVIMKTNDETDSSQILSYFRKRAEESSDLLSKGPEAVKEYFEAVISAIKRGDGREEPPKLDGASKPDDPN